MRAQQGVAQRYKVPRYLSCLYGKLSLGFCCLAEIDLQVCGCVRAYWQVSGVLQNAAPSDVLFQKRAMGIPGRMPTDLADRRWELRSDLPMAGVLQPCNRQTGWCRCLGVLCGASPAVTAPDRHSLSARRSWVGVREGWQGAEASPSVPGI